MASGQIANVDLSASLYDGSAILLLARGELGQTEYTPKNKRKPNERVCEYFRDCGYKVTDSQNPLNTPWCALYIGAILKRAGYANTKSAMARSYIGYGSLIYDNKTKKGSLNDARPGDIVINWRGSRDDHVTGHIFFYLRHDKNYIYGIGGNQGDSVTEAKFPISRCLQIRRARNVPLVSKTILSAGGSAGTGASAEVVNQVEKAFNMPAADGPLGIVSSSVDMARPLGDMLPTIAMVLTVLSVGLAIFAIWWRYSDYRQTGL